MCSALCQAVAGGMEQNRRVEPAAEGDYPASGRGFDSQVAGEGGNDR